MANQFTAWTYIDDQVKECSDCRKRKSHSEFHRNKSAKRNRGLCYYCKECACRRSRKTHQLRYKSDEDYREQKRRSYIKNRFGLSLEQYLEKLKAQDFKCALCGVELPTNGHITHLDHCHTTGKLRDFLCTNCNRGLGHFQDNPDVLRKAAFYIESHSVSDDDTKEDIVNDSSH